MAKRKIASATNPTRATNLVPSLMATQTATMAAGTRRAASATRQKRRVSAIRASHAIATTWVTPDAVAAAMKPRCFFTRAVAVAMINAPIAGQRRA